MERRARDQERRHEIARRAAERQRTGAATAPLALGSGGKQAPERWFGGSRLVAVALVVVLGAVVFVAGRVSGGPSAADQPAAATATPERTTAAPGTAAAPTTAAAAGAAPSPTAVAAPTAVTRPTSTPTATATPTQPPPPATAEPATPPPPLPTVAPPTPKPPNLYSIAVAPKDAARLAISSCRTYGVRATSDDGSPAAGATLLATFQQHLDGDRSNDTLDRIDGVPSNPAAGIGGTGGAAGRMVALQRTDASGGTSLTVCAESTIFVTVEGTRPATPLVFQDFNGNAALDAFESRDTGGSVSFR